MLSPHWCQCECHCLLHTVLDSSEIVSPMCKGIQAPLASEIQEHMSQEQASVISVSCGSSFPCLQAQKNAKEIVRWPWSPLSIYCQRFLLPGRLLYLRPSKNDSKEKIATTAFCRILHPLGIHDAEWSKGKPAASFCFPLGLPTNSSTVCAWTMRKETITSPFLLIFLL